MSEEFKAAQQRVRQEFTSLILGNETSLDLARAALLIAAEEYPYLDCNQHLMRLEELAEQVRARMASLEMHPAHPPLTANECFDVLHAMNSVLFDQERFRGNRIDYYNPQNSFLNRVLERRLGIPLTLSLVYMEVGKRLGLHIAGVGMPFHFIVRCDFQHASIYIDPYEKATLAWNHDPKRSRKLLVHKRELRKLEAATSNKGTTLIPLAVYWKNGLAKLELGVAKGKQQHDKRDTIRKKEQDREMRRAMSHRQ